MRIGVDVRSLQTGHKTRIYNFYKPFPTKRSKYSCPDCQAITEAETFDGTLRMNFHNIKI